MNEKTIKELGTIATEKGFDNKLTEFLLFIDEDFVNQLVYTLRNNKVDDVEELPKAIGVLVSMALAYGIKSEREDKQCIKNTLQ